jgi:hypothetical protein
MQRWSQIITESDEFEPIGADKSTGCSQSKVPIRSLCNCLNYPVRQAILHTPGMVRYPHTCGLGSNGRCEKRTEKNAGEYVPSNVWQVPRKLRSPK